jgi:SH3-like domain-containing protein
VNIREARLIQQWLDSKVSSATRSNILAFVKDDVKVITKVKEELENSELYNKVGKDIENKAKELVETKCKPEWDRISEEMKPLGEERNRLAKEKAEAKE